MPSIIPLSVTLATLYSREINFGMQSFWDSGIDVWIGDEMNGRRAEANISGESPHDVSRWLQEAANELYPGADFPWPRRAPVIFQPEDAKATPPRAILQLADNPALDALREVRAMCPTTDPGPAWDRKWGGWVSDGNTDDVARDAANESMWEVAKVCDRVLNPAECGASSPSEASAGNLAQDEQKAGRQALKDAGHGG